MSSITTLLYVYNHDKWLSKAIESILAQSLEHQIVIIDDASSDTSFDIIQSFSLNQPQIKVIRFQEHQGKVYGLNRGLIEVKTDYVAFAESDFISVKDRYSKQYQFLESNSDFGVVGSFVNNDLINFKKRNWTASYIEAVLFFGNPIHHSSVMARSKIFAQQANNYRPLFENFMADHDLWLRIKRNWKFNILPEDLVIDLLSQDEISRYRSKKQADAATDFYVKHLNRLFNYSPASAELKKQISLYLGNEAEKFGHPRKFRLWFDKLLALNEQYNAFPQEEFKTAVEYQWKRLGWLLRNYSIRRYAQYEKQNGKFMPLVYIQLILKGAKLK
ncbi:MAG: glycosyltransferase [Bacteroidota bacterium]|nr:glycosyltransferase [Bacteroidota bacterium]